MNYHGVGTVQEARAEGRPVIMNTGKMKRVNIDRVLRVTVGQPKLYKLDIKTSYVRLLRMYNETVKDQRFNRQETVSLSLWYSTVCYIFTLENVNLSALEQKR